MSMREFQDALLVVGGKPTFVQEGSAFLLTQVAKRNDPYKILPPGVALPGYIRRVASCQHGQNCIWELRQKGCAQPAIERSENLISIDQDHGPLRRSIQQVWY